MTAEHDRMAEARSGAADWRRWGTYLSERAWGTVREDYSTDGDAWAYLPFDHARSRAYRWNEDGLAGWCDRDQILCLGLALWNGKDAILKERPFGLSNAQGNHGEDVKDYWFYTDNLPTHSYASMVYKYPQVAFPYDDLVSVNGSRGQDEPEYELFDALEEAWRANRYFDVNVEYAKATPEHLVWRTTVVNRGSEAAVVHVLPQIWYRNTWSWQPGAERPRLTRAGPGEATTVHPQLGERWFSVVSSDGHVPELLFCENETNRMRLFGDANEGPVKDGIDDAVVRGDRAAVSEHEGSKVAAHVTATVQPGATLTVTVRFAPSEHRLPVDDGDQVIHVRRTEADEFYAAVARAGLSEDERLVQRQALAGLLWCKQFYHYGVRRWLQGDPGQPPPPQSRRTGRNHDWQHMVMHDIVLMPDAWEYPWFAAWDLGFHATTMAMIDPDFAKQQVLLLLTSLTQHPHGQVPAYEWSFGDTNPPLHVWAAWHVYQMDMQSTGHADVEFLATCYHAITLDVMWWLNQKDRRNRGVFGGGFLGMDNIGVFDRDKPLPTGGSLAQVDGTAWIAALLLRMLLMTVELADQRPSFASMFGRWVWDAWLVANALENGSQNVSFWNERTSFYHDVIETPSGVSQSLEVFSMQSLVPLFSVVAVPVDHDAQIGEIRAHLAHLREAYDEPTDAVRLDLAGGDGTHALFGIVDVERLACILDRMLDPEQFLSLYGVRSLSRYHRDHPYTWVAGNTTYEVAYTPAESTNRMFGGNSNWRGPVWFPMNLMLVHALDDYARSLGSTFLVKDPGRSGSQVELSDVVGHLSRRLCSIFLRGEDGRRPVLGSNDYMQTDPHWRDLIPFYEYFDGDDGHGVGASHQTGWTASVALLLQRSVAEEPGPRS